MLYFENRYAELATDQPVLRGALQDRLYRARWLDPRTGR